LLLVVTHCLRVCFDLSTGGAGANSRPDVDAVEDRRLMASPIFKSAGETRQLRAQFGCAVGEY
jgi:hypothetical protein